MGEKREGDGSVCVFVRGRARESKGWERAERECRGWERGERVGRERE